MAFGESQDPNMAFIGSRDLIMAFVKSRVSDMDLSQKTIPQLEQLLIDIVLKAEVCGLAWANARSQYETQKSKAEKVFSMVCDKYEGSQAHKEKKATFDDSYSKCVDELNDLRAIDLRSKIEYDISLLKVDSIRTILSNRREMVKREIL